MSLLSRRLVVFEQGGVDRSRRDYSSAHLSDDIRAETHQARVLLSRKNGGSEALQWVLSEYRLSPDNDPKGDLPTVIETETMVLRRVQDSWRIIHIHWSVQR